MESQVALDGVRGEKDLAIVGQDQQESVEGLFFCYLKRKRKPESTNESSTIKQPSFTSIGSIVSRF